MKSREKINYVRQTKFISIIVVLLYTFRKLNNNIICLLRSMCNITQHVESYLCLQCSIIKIYTIIPA